MKGRLILLIGAIVGGLILVCVIVGILVKPSEDTKKLSSGVLPVETAQAQNTVKPLEPTLRPSIALTAAPTDTPESPTPEPTAEPSPTKRLATHEIGEVIALEGHTIVLNAVDLEGGVLRLNFTIENTGNEDILLSSILSFWARDSEGNKLELDIFGCGSSSLDGTVVPGDKLKGDLCYRSPVGDAMKVYYKPGLFAGPTIVWAVSDESA